jgi:hypothetical protein
LNKRNIKGGGGLTKTKKTALIAALCAVFLTQCEVWNKPLIEEIEKTSGGEDAQIERLVIVSPPWPNTFYIGDDEPDWKELGLKVSAVSPSGDWTELDTSDYEVKGFDKATLGKQTITIHPKNRNAQYAEFYIEILDAALEYYNIEPYAGNYGKVIPFPSKIEKNEKNIKITLYIYPDEGYIIKSISYEATGEGGAVRVTPPSETDYSNIWTFNMPAGKDIDLKAEFRSREGVGAMRVVSDELKYYTTLKEAIASIEDHGQGTISILDNLTLDECISITEKKNIMIVSYNRESITLTRKTETGSLFSIDKGATLTLSGAAGNLTIDGGELNDTPGPLIAVNGGTLSIINGPGSKTTGVTLKNNKSGSLVNATSPVDPITIIEREKAGVLIQDGGYFNMESGVICGNEMGVLTANGGKFEMNGGVIKDNLVGGVFVSNPGVFDMNGGVIERNGEKVLNMFNKPIGVLATGEFTMGGNARVEKDNFVYFTGAGVHPIKVEPDNLPDLAASIIINANVNIDVTVLVHRAEGKQLTDTDIEKFELLSEDRCIDYINGEGVLAVSEVELSIIDKDFTRKYASLQKAVSAAKEGGVENKIKLLKSVEIDSTIEIKNKNIKLVTANPEGNSIKRKEGFKTALFDIPSGGKLTLGGGGAPLVIDGGEYAATEALIKVSGSGEVTMNDEVMLINNKSGGGVYMEGGMFTMNGGVISGNKVNTVQLVNGGGVFIKGGGIFTMNSGEISGNTATNYGGGVYMKDGIFTMNGGAISNGNTANNGGGVYMAGGTFTLNINGRISNNIMAGKGGGVFMEGGTFTNNGEISENEAASGGGVYIIGGEFKLNSNGKISGNKADNGYGGGVYMTGGEFAMDGGEISGENTAKYGGGVYMTGDNSTFTMKGGAIIGNTAAASSGGGVCMANGTFTMDSGEISENTAKYGGGVCMDGGIFMMKGGAIIGNLEAGAGGGVYMCNNSVFTMTSGKISDNTANKGNGNGGGVFMTDNSEFTMKGGAIIGNTANNGNGNGGGVYMTGDNSTFTMTSGVISGNKADNGNGGGVYMKGGEFAMDGGEISNGNTANDGGGVYIIGGEFKLNSNGKISGNKADNGYGGGVYMKGGAFTMYDGEISGNIMTSSSNGGGGGVFMEGGEFTMYDGEISSNTAANGGGVYMYSGAFEMTSGTISSNTANVNGGGVYMKGGTFDPRGEIIGNTPNDVYPNDIQMSQ